MSLPARDAVTSRTIEDVEDLASDRHPLVPGAAPSPRRWYLCGLDWIVSSAASAATAVFANAPHAAQERSPSVAEEPASEEDRAADVPLDLDGLHQLIANAGPLPVSITLAREEAGLAVAITGPLVLSAPSRALIDIEDAIIDQFALPQGLPIRSVAVTNCDFDGLEARRQEFVDCAVRVVNFINAMLTGCSEDGSSKAASRVHLTRVAISPLQLLDTFKLPLTGLTELRFEQCGLSDPHLGALVRLGRRREDTLATLHTLILSGQFSAQGLVGLLKLFDEELEDAQLHHITVPPMHQMVCARHPYWQRRVGATVNNSPLKQN